MNLPDSSSLADRAESALAACGVEWPAGDLSARTPITGTQLRTVRQHSGREVDDAVEAAHRAFLTWRTVPAPARGAVVRRLGSLLTEHKDDLAEIVTLEAGKVTSEALGEVQEMIDICEFAVGLSRQLYGRTMPSERPGHPVDGNVAPSRRCRSHLRVQLSRRGVVVEYRHCSRVRRRRRLEAFGDHDR